MASIKKLTEQQLHDKWYLLWLKGLNTNSKVLRQQYVDEMLKINARLEQLKNN